MDDWKDYIIALRQMANDIGITQIGIAERTGIKQGHVSRFFSCENVPRFDTFLRIAEAVGASLHVSGRDETKE